MAEVKLCPHQFDPTLSNQEIANICKRYFRRVFKKRDGSGQPAPFCKTHDGIDVEYSFDDNHLLTEDDTNSGFRRLNKLRAERIHWIRPIIEGRAKKPLYFRNTQTGRIYYIKRLEYEVVLNIANNRLRLISAYRITHAEKRKRLHRDLHKFTEIR